MIMEFDFVQSIIIYSAPCCWLEHSLLVSPWSFFCCTRIVN